MACFTRFFPRPKSSRSYCPAQDENKETVLVDINKTGLNARYIPLEPTPILEPKHNSLQTPELRVQRDQQEAEEEEDQLQQHNLANGSNKINGTNSNTTVVPKKFISNKNKNLLTNNNNNSSSFNNKNTNSLHLQIPNSNAHNHAKLKPVKERRPTALPSDVPHLGDDATDSRGVTPLSTPTSPNVRFFIGNNDGDGDSMSVVTNTSFEPSIRTTDVSRSGVSEATTKSNTPHEGIYIPTPPPMPSKLLVPAFSEESLWSKMSAKSRRRTCDVKLKNNLNMSFTISEVLNCCSSDSFTDYSFNGRDSGVQVEDQASTPDSDGTDSLKSHRMQGGLIFTRSNLPMHKDDAIETIEKDEATRRLIRIAIERNDFLNNYMDKDRKEMVIDAMSAAYYPEGSYIIHENDEGSEIYVSEEGDFDVLKGDQLIGGFGPGTVFGELAILYNATRFASIKARTDTRVWQINREKFRKIMIISGSKEREENLSFLRSAPFLTDLSDEVLNKIVDLLQRKFYETHTCIIREGDVGNEFFIIRGGTVTIKKLNEDHVERTVARRKRGEYFGEQALLNADRRQASVYADAPGTEVLKLDREAFISYLGTIPQLREKPGDDDGTSGRGSNRKSDVESEYKHVLLTDLKMVATLGAGAFGRVDLVEFDGKTYALKIIKKIDIVKQDQIEHVYSEKHVMMKCRHSPFIIELYKTFRNEKYVYFLMEACMGGDVWTVMSQRRCFDEKTARFIAGCVVEAFEFLHSHNIIYRDLKPENLMLTTDGYCKLVDFGFAKVIPHNQKTNTFAGTPEYVAPEIILDRGHDRAVDYWALGILIYELLVGKSPFRGQNQIKIYQQILSGIDVIQMPSKIHKTAQHLIKHLCKQLPVERLGYQRKGIADIKKHSWFDSLDWEKLKNKQLNSPIKRPINSNTDLQYFGPAGVENDHEPPDETSGWDIDF